MHFFCSFYKTCQGEPAPAGRTRYTYGVKRLAVLSDITNANSLCLIKKGREVWAAIENKLVMYGTF